MKMILSTQEGYLKDQKPDTKRKARESRQFFTFNGEDAPLKTVRAIMQKYGISKEDL